MYTRTAMDHFLRPRNVGDVPGGSVGEALNPDCGDTARIAVRIEGGRVVEARFRSLGCSGALASCSAATALLTGRAIEEAAVIEAAEIERLLDGLPPEKRGCAEMAAEAARAAVAKAR